MKYLIEASHKRRQLHAWVETITDAEIIEHALKFCGWMVTIREADKDLLQRVQP